MMLEKVKNYLEENGMDVNGTGEYVVDFKVNGKLYDLTVAVDREEVDVIECYTLKQVKDNTYARDVEVMDKDIINNCIEQMTAA